MHELTERVDLGEILSKLKRNVRNLSSIAGLRVAMEFPIALFLGGHHHRPAKEPKGDAG